MTHDEAVERLKKKNRHLKRKSKRCGNPSLLEQALDYAIAELEKRSTIPSDTYTIEPIATQFDERVAKLKKGTHGHWSDDALSLVEDMQSHIRKLESRQ